MIGSIARKEILDIARDGRARVISGLVVALLVLGTVGGIRHVLSVRADHARGHAEERHAWTHQGEKNPHAATHFGQWVYRPVLVLEAFDPGIASFIGSAQFLESHKINASQFRPASDRVHPIRIGRVLPADLIQILIPILIIALTATSLSQEQERGTLRQLLGLGLDPRHLALGKVAGSLLAVSAILGPFLLVWWLLVFILESHLSGGEIALRGLILVSSYGLFLLAWVLLGLAASCRTLHSGRSLTTLFCIWIGTTFVLPPVLAAGCRAWIPIPAPSQIQHRIAEETEAREAEVERRLDVRARELMAEHGVTEIDALPVNFQSFRFQEGEAMQAEVAKHVLGEVDAARDRQDGIMRLASLISPYLAIAQISRALAGTDGANHRVYRRALEEHRFAFVQQLNEELEHQKRIGAAALERVPTFSFEIPSIMTRLTALTCPILALLLWVFIPTILLMTQAPSMAIRSLETSR